MSEDRQQPSHGETPAVIVHILGDVFEETQYDDESSGAVRQSREVRVSIVGGEPEHRWVVRHNETTGQLDR